MEPTLREGTGVTSLAVLDAGPNVAPIPDSILAWAEKGGKVVGLAAAMDGMRTVMSSMGKFPLEIDMLSDDLKRDLRRAGYRLRDGEACLGDCILYEQPVQLRDQYREHYAERQLLAEQSATDAPDQIAEKYERAAMDVAHAKVLRVQAEQNHPVREHVRRGTEIAEDVKNKLSGAETAGNSPRRR